MILLSCKQLTVNLIFLWRIKPIILIISWDNSYLEYWISIYWFLKNHDITQPLYSGNTGVLGMFINIELYFNSLTHYGPDHGYYPKTSKSVLIVHLDTIEAEKSLTGIMGFRFAQARITLAVLLGTKIPNKIGCRILHWHGKKTFAWSAKHWWNITRKVMLRWTEQLNRSISCFNAWF